MGDLLGMYFYGTVDKRLDNQTWVTADGKRPFVLQPGFRSQKQLFSKVFVAARFVTTARFVKFDAQPARFVTRARFVTTW